MAMTVGTIYPKGFEDGINVRGNTEEIKKKHNTIQAEYEIEKDEIKEDTKEQAKEGTKSKKK